MVQSPFPRSESSPDQHKSERVDRHGQAKTKSRKTDESRGQERDEGSMCRRTAVVAESDGEEAEHWSSRRLATMPASSPFPASRALVHVPRDADDTAEEEPLDDPRRSDVDEWGRSEKARQMLAAFYEFYYSVWFRAEWEGLEHIPTEGGALLIANHAGAMPPDAPVIMHGIEKELHRPVYGMAAHFFRTIPFAGVAWSRLGGVPAKPENAYRLLREQQQLALVFPEGLKGPTKTYTHRYQLNRFGRGGFVEIAMRSGVPIVPICVVGAEEAMPVLFQLPTLAKLLGLPALPITANVLAMGPIGALTYFPAKFKLKVLPPIAFDDVEPDQDRYPRSRVLAEAELIRTTMQQTLYEMLAERRSVWFG